MACCSACEKSGGSCGDANAKPPVDGRVSADMTTIGPRGQLGATGMANPTANWPTYTAVALGAFALAVLVTRMKKNPRDLSDEQRNEMLYAYGKGGRKIRSYAGIDRLYRQGKITENDRHYLIQHFQPFI